MTEYDNMKAEYERLKAAEHDRIVHNSPNVAALRNRLNQALDLLNTVYLYPYARTSGWMRDCFSLLKECGR